MTRCKYVLVSSASPSLARKVTVPPVPGNEVYVCKHFRCFKLLSANRIAPPFGAAAGVVANWRSRDRDVEARRSSKVNVAKQQVHEREPRKASWPLCMEAFGES